MVAGSPIFARRCVDRVYRGAQGDAGPQVERKGDRGKQPLMGHRQRRGGGGS